MDDNMQLATTNITPFDQQFAEKLGHVLDRYGEPREDRPYMKITPEFSPEGFEDSSGAAVQISQVKLLTATSKEVDNEDAPPEAKAGVFWHTDLQTPLPKPLIVVPLYGFDIDYTGVKQRFENRSPIVKVMTFTTEQFLAESLNKDTSWLPEVLNKKNHTLALDLLSNCFSMYLTGMSEKIYEEIKTQTNSGAGLCQRLYTLSTEDAVNTAGKKYRKLTLMPKRLLTNDEQVVAYTLQDIIKAAKKENDVYFEARRAQYPNGGNFVKPDQNTAPDGKYTDLGDNVPPPEVEHADDGM